MPAKKTCRINGKMSVAAFLVCALFAVSSLTAEEASLWVKNISSASDSAGGYNHAYAQIAVAGRYVHIAWLAAPAGGSGPNMLMYRRSIDSGKTFDTPKNLATSDASDFYPIGFDPKFRGLAADSSFVHIVYTVGWPSKLKYFRSSDNGATFDTARTWRSGYYSYSGIYTAASGSNIAVGWGLNGSDAPNPHGLYCSFSSDGGANFTITTVAYSDNNTLAQIEGRYVNGYSAVDLALSGARVYLLAIAGVSDGTYSPPSYLRLLSSTDGGTTFKAPLNVSLKSNNNNHYAANIQDADYSPNLAASGDTMHVVFYNIESPGDAIGYSLRVRTSTDAGASFRDSVVLRNYPASYNHGVQPGLETIRQSGSNLYVVTSLTADPYGTYFWRSHDAGVTWDSVKTLSAGGWWPQAAVDPTNGNRLCVANSSYYRSSDAGASFDGGVNPHLVFGDWQSPQLAMGPDGAAHYVFGSSSNGSNYGHAILYRRLAPEPVALSANTCLGLIKTGQTRADNMQVAASPSINFSTAMTAEFWVKLDSADVGLLEPLFNKKRASGYGSYMIGTWNPYQIYARIVTDSATNASAGYWLGSGVTLQKNVWTHIAMTYDKAAGGNNWCLYVNGLLAASAAIKGKIVTETADAPLVIGRDDQYYSGSFKIDEVRLWNRARTQAEIIAGMQTEMTGAESGLAACYSFNGTFKDITGHGNDGIPMYRETFTPLGSKPPMVTALTPANRDSSVSTGAHLVLTFNEPIVKGIDTITITAPMGWSPEPVFERIAVSSDSVTVNGNSVTIRTITPFSVNKKYYVTMQDSCFKNAGNIYFPGIASVNSWAFTTGSEVPAISKNGSLLIDRTAVTYHSGGLNLAITLSENSVLSGKVYSFSGRVVHIITEHTLRAGVSALRIPVSLATGIYTCELTKKKISGTGIFRRSFVVIR